MLLKPQGWSILTSVPLRGNIRNIFARPIVLHMASNKLPCCQSRHKGELPSKHRTSYNCGQKPCVWSCWFSVCTLHPKQVQARWLRSKLGTSTNRTNLQRKEKKKKQSYYWPAYSSTIKWFHKLLLYGNNFFLKTNELLILLGNPKFLIWDCK